MNLTLLLDMAADAMPDRVLIGGRETGLTSAALRAAAHAGAQRIVDEGADAVLFLAVNGPALPVALFAAALAGVPLVPVNYRLGEEQLDVLLAHHPKAFGIADEGAPSAALHRAGISGRTPETWLAETAGGGVEAVPAETDAPAVIIYTSGTTAEPKGVLLRHANLVSYVLGSVEFASAADTDAALISVPPYHIAAIANVITNVYAGRRAFVLERFSPQQWLEVVAEEAITNALVVPTMLARIVEEIDDVPVPSLRTLAYGGAPMSLPVLCRVLRAWPEVDFVNAYGLTETSSTIAVLGPDHHREALDSPYDHVRARLGSAGRPVPSIELEVRALDGTVVGPGEVGRIWVRGEQVSAEYAGIGSTLDERGFFDTRDEGYLDVDGFLFIGGRADDTIIRGAENIAPAEIEDVMLRHPAVSDVVVVGVPDEEWGQRIEAAVVLRSDASATAGDLQEHVRAHLRGSKTPERIVFWDELPRTETGKLVRRRALAQITAD